MKNSKIKSFDSLEDSYLQALEQTELPEKEGVKPGGDSSVERIRMDAGTDLLSSPENPFRNIKGWQGKQLFLSADHMTLTLMINEGGDPVSVERIDLALRKFGIVHGIDPAAIKKAERLSRLPTGNKVIIARGTPPQWKNACMFSFATQPATAPSVVPSLPNGLKLDFALLKSLVTAPDLPTIQGAGIQVKAVSPGEIFLKVLKFPEATPGKDLFGQTLECPEAPLADAGEYVQFNEKKSGYESTLYGYLCIDNNTVSLVPPVWISPDRQAAHYIFLPQMPPVRYPTIAELKHVLLLKGIDERCINASALEKMTNRMAAGLSMPRVVKLAETVQPLNGKHAVFTIFVDAEKKAGKIRGNGSIDLRERNAVVSMPAGSLIAEKNPATKGEDGCTLFGKKIKATPGADKPVTVGQGVKTEKTAERILYFAARNGNVKFAAGTLSVADIYEISGNIDYNSGNIDIKTDLLVKGSVLSGFSVKAEGNIAVMDSVENGATIVAQGDLTVGKGILGGNTRVVAHGSISAGFIQDAEVIAKGDVLIKSYLFNAMLIANGSITVLKDQSSRSGSAVGGMICSSRGIQLSVIGSPGTSSTVVAVRTDPAMTAQLRKLDEQKLLCGENIAKISHSLPFDVFDAKVIKSMLVGLPAGKREKIILLLTNLNKLIKHQKTLQEHITAMRAGTEEALANARIQVTEKIYAGSEIHIGDKKLVIPADMGPSLFRLRNQQIVRN
ncbi:MAG: hypothetical protein BM485_06470 [Desulfobulbaceae bacterium DB1]|nr:MAG: hypothetical protein BM485_06470 [Desulfobulbaceae bacterium DB1]